MTPDTTATTDTREIVGQFFDRLAAGDAESMAALCADDADWYIPGNERLAPWVGRRSGRDQFAAVYASLFAAIEPVHAEIEHTFIDGEHVAVTGSFASRMRATGKVLESPFSAYLVVRDGLIVRYRLLEDSFGLVEALTPDGPTAATPRPSTR
jgi:uncharacterized protein